MLEWGGDFKYVACVASVCVCARVYVACMRMCARAHVPVQGAVAASVAADAVTCRFTTRAEADASGMFFARTGAHRRRLCELHRRTRSGLKSSSNSSGEGVNGSGGGDGNNDEGCAKAPPVLGLPCLRSLRALAEARRQFPELQQDSKKRENAKGNPGAARVYPDDAFAASLGWWIRALPCAGSSEGSAL